MPEQTSGRIFPELIQDAMHNLPFIGLLLACLTVGTYSTWRYCGDFIKDFFSVGEDQWTWTTRSGDLYEDAEISGIEDHEILLQHRFGAARLAIDSLSDDSRLHLLRSPQWAHHISSAPAQGKITTFALESAEEPVHATQAA